jgi:hypothetical protein
MGSAVICKAISALLSNKLTQQYYHYTSVPIEAAQKYLAKVLRLLVQRIFFLRCLKPVGWYLFSYGLLVVLNGFHQCFVLKLLLILHFTKAVLSKTTFRSIFES